ncbi:MAG: response regulator [Candidatus Aureabacteria bacterium]|nr:response regulator [Candidatus Auribacterota bacterium]
MSKSVLILDDSIALRKLIRYSVNRVYKNLEYHEASNGQEGLDILRSGVTVDVIISDINMPVMDGIAFLKEKMKDPVMREIPTIVLSKKDKSDLMLTVEQYGIVEYLPKPFNVSKMKEVLMKILEDKNR